jgi:hypothetical protein
MLRSQLAEIVLRCYSLRLESAAGMVVKRQHPRVRSICRRASPIPVCRAAGCRWVSGSARSSGRPLHLGAVERLTISAPGCSRPPAAPRADARSPRCAPCRAASPAGCEPLNEAPCPPLTSHGASIRRLVGLTCLGRPAAPRRQSCAPAANRSVTNHGRLLQAIYGELAARQADNAIAKHVES